MLEFLLKLLQISIIMLKKRVHPQQNKDVIISDQMLKFHQDIREKVSLKYAFKKK